MSLLIDGYNLLHIVGILGPHVGPGGLERARLALLNFLAESLDTEQIKHTTVVFDAHDTPWGLPEVLHHRGLTVRFATKYDDADSLIEELIRRDSAPRRLLVVSSDHRLHRAARHRRAKAISSEQWYADTVRRRQQRRRPAADVVDAPARPALPLLEDDINYWVAQFGGESLLGQLIEEEAAQPPRAAAGPAAEEGHAQEAPADKPSADEMTQIGNPFPPGYAEELWEQE